MTTQSALQSAGVLELAEAVCAHYGTTLDVAVKMTHGGKRAHVRHVLYSVLFVLGWTQSRIAEVFDCDHKTVSAALDTVLMTEVRRFVPRAEVA
jgi:hypothetical protein